MEANKEKEGLLERLEALEKKLATVTTQQAPATQAAVQLALEAAAQCNHTIVYTPAELPSLKTKPPAVYKKQLVLVATNLRQWELYGNQPLTYAQLLSGAGDQKSLSEAFRTLQDIAGEVIWKRVYGDTTVADGQYVPFQMREILLCGLEAAEEAMTEFMKLANYEDQAETRFKELHEATSEPRRLAPALMPEEQCAL